MNYKKLTKKEKEDYEIIYNSNSFDYTYYYNKYHLNRSVNPILHFLKIGVEKGYNPSPLFDTKFYINLYSDVKKADINPFVHYLIYGKKEKRIPKGITYNKMIELKLPKKYVLDYLIIINYGEFDEKYYTKKYHINKNTNPIVHFLETGAKKGYNPTPKFDTKFYLNQNPDVKKANINPYIHYIKYGKQEKRIPKGITYNKMIELKLPKKYVLDYLIIINYGEFDEKYYTKKYHINKNTNPIVHFLETGAKKGYNPTPKFDTKFYLNQNPDVKKANINPYIHYIKYGKQEKRMPHNLKRINFKNK